MPAIVAAFGVIHLFDGCEFRASQLNYDTERYFRKAKAMLKMPLMLTWKGKLQKSLLEQVLKLSPDFIDVDYRIEYDVYEELKREFPLVKWVLSYHNFDGTDKNLADRLEMLQQKKADYYKMAFFANSSVDALEVCLFMKSLESTNVTLVSMGLKGEWTRVLMGYFGSAFSYTCLPRKQTAPGQIPIDELCGVYHYHRIKKDAALYGLIGSPVMQSYSHITHNELMGRYKLNAVYIKALVEESEMEEALPLIQKLGFKGLSVTAPLKALVVPSQVVNTLMFGADPINTDGTAALQLLEEKIDLSQSRVLIIGAGGAAFGIAKELKSAGAELFIFNRTEKKIAPFIQELGAKSHVQNALYDVVVQAASEFNPDLCHFTCEKIALEVVANPIVTPFIEKCKEEGCTIIYGYEMFALQAAHQFKYWFKEQVPSVEEIYREIDQFFARSRASAVSKK